MPGTAHRDSPAKARLTGVEHTVFFLSLLPEELFPSQQKAFPDSDLAQRQSGLPVHFTGQRHIPEPQFQRVHVQPTGRHVQVVLHHGVHLRGAPTPVSTGHRRIGAHRSSPVIRVRITVAPKKLAGQGLNIVAGVSHVSTRVQNDIRPHTPDFSLGRNFGDKLCVNRPAGDRGNHAFRPIIDQLYGPPCPQRGRHRDGLQNPLLLCAEAAAHGGLDYPYLFIGQVKQLRQNRANSIDRLIGTPDGQLLHRPIPRGDAAMGFHGHMGQAGQKGFRHSLHSVRLHFGLFAEGKVHLAKNGSSGMNAVDFSLQCLRNRGCKGQRVIRNLYQGCRFPCGLRRFGEHAAHAVPHIPDMPFKYSVLLQRLLPLHGPKPVIWPICGVKAVQHIHHSVNLHCPVNIYFRHISMGNLTEYNGRIERAREIKIPPISNRAGYFCLCIVNRPTAPNNFHSASPLSFI
ncbi:hypothetical protein SDC9_118050 [bioreactor metagenome]|uniref:Uncharacterized protein n=1 Tax=bioreactor metagenome TaxID=1076179 RepID=A0A645C191_9ZZZZ